MVPYKQITVSAYSPVELPRLEPPYSVEYSYYYGDKHFRPVCKYVAIESAVDSLNIMYSHQRRDPSFRLDRGEIRYRGMPFLSLEPEVKAVGKYGFEHTGLHVWRAYMDDPFVVD